LRLKGREDRYPAIPAPLRDHHLLLRFPLQLFIQTLALWTSASTKALILLRNVNSRSWKGYDYTTDDSVMLYMLVPTSVPLYNSFMGMTPRWLLFNPMFSLPRLPLLLKLVFSNNTTSSFDSKLLSRLHYHYYFIVLLRKEPQYWLMVNGEGLVYYWNISTMSFQQFSYNI
jgi:hypothetical protein